MLRAIEFKDKKFMTKNDNNLFSPITENTIILCHNYKLMDSLSKCLWSAIAIFIIQQIEGNILSPKITGDSTNIHPLVIVILLLVGEKLGGFIGMILVIPIAVVIKVIYEDVNYSLFS